MSNDKKGHRKRLRDKFIRIGIDALNDYEIVELLLSLGTPRKDCKKQAKEAIKKFNGLQGVLDADVYELQEINGIGPVNAFGIKLFQEVAEKYFKENMKKSVIFNSSDSVIKYLHHSMNRNKKEIFKVLFLDSKNKLIDAKDMFGGTVNVSVVYTREVMKEALKCNAAALIFVHNHPSGDTTPSKSDIEVTKELCYASRLLQIRVLDHIIVGKNIHYSFADEGFINKWISVSSLS